MQSYALSWLVGHCITTLCHNKDDYRCPPALSWLGIDTVKVQLVEEFRLGLVQPRQHIIYGPHSAAQVLKDALKEMPLFSFGNEEICFDH